MVSTPATAGQEKLPVPALLVTVCAAKQAKRWKTLEKKKGVVEVWWRREEGGDCKPQNGQEVI